MLVCLLVRQELIEWCFEKQVFSKQHFWKNIVKEPYALRGQCLAGTFLPHSWPNTCVEDVNYSLASVSPQSLYSSLIFPLHKILPPSWKKGSQYCTPRLPSLFQPLSSFSFRAGTGNECIFFTPNPFIFFLQPKLPSPFQYSFHP